MKNTSPTSEPTIQSLIKTVVDALHDANDNLEINNPNYYYQFITADVNKLKKYRLSVDYVYSTFTLYDIFKHFLEDLPKKI